MIMVIKRHITDPLRGLLHLFPSLSLFLCSNSRLESIDRDLDVDMEMVGTFCGYLLRCASIDDDQGLDPNTAGASWLAGSCVVLTCLLDAYLFVVLNMHVTSAGFSTLKATDT